MQNAIVALLIILSLVFTMGRSRGLQKLGAVLFLLAFIIVYRASN